MKKYRLTEKTKTVFRYGEDVILHRIQALKDFSVSEYKTVKVGNLGGWVESEMNLSQEGNSWIANEAEAYGNARIYGNAWVADNTAIFGCAQIYENANIGREARIYDNARIFGNADVVGQVFGDAWVYDNAAILDESMVYNNARVYGNAQVNDNVEVGGDAHVYENASLWEFTSVTDNAQVHGNVTISGNGCFNAYADVFKNEHYLVVGPMGKDYQFMTFFRNYNPYIKELEVYINFDGYKYNIDVKRFLNFYVKRAFVEYQPAYAAAANLALLRVKLD
ncbi:MAG: hypothetical protein LUC97_05600 [Clostridiales bacterium]|nr:hypothetical protein [Clostridiales bacterium]